MFVFKFAGANKYFSEKLLTQVRSLCKEQRSGHGAPPTPQAISRMRYGSAALTASPASATSGIYHLLFHSDNTSIICLHGGQRARCHVVLLIATFVLCLLVLCSLISMRACSTIESYHCHDHYESLRFECTLQEQVHIQFFLHLVSISSCRLSVHPLTITLCFSEFSCTIISFYKSTNIT